MINWGAAGETSLLRLDQIRSKNAREGDGLTQSLQKGGEQL